MNPKANAESPSGVWRKRSVASPAANPKIAPSSGPEADRERDRGDEPEVGHDAGDAQVRHQRRLQDDEERRAAARGARRGSRDRPFEDAHELGASPASANSSHGDARLEVTRAACRTDVDPSRPGCPAGTGRRRCRRSRARRRALIVTGARRGLERLQRRRRARPLMIPVALGLRVAHADARVAVGEQQHGRRACPTRARSRPRRPRRTRPAGRRRCRRPSPC